MLNDYVKIGLDTQYQLNRKKQNNTYIVSKRTHRGQTRLRVSIDTSYHQT